MAFTQTELEALDRAALDNSVNQHDLGGPKGERIANRWRHRTLGLVLAGGQGERMGGIDKASIAIGGMALIDHVLTRLEPQADRIIISANGDPDRFGATHTVVADAKGEPCGPLGGLLAAMRWAQENAPHAFWILSAAVDTPFFPTDLADRLITAMSGPAPSVVLARSGDRVHPTFGLWPVALADQLEAYLDAGERKAMLFAEQHNCARVVFSGFMVDDIEIDPFFNLNTPEDVEIAEAIVEGLAEQADS